MDRLRIISASALALVLAAGTPLWAKSKCSGAKLKTAGKVAAGQLKCYGKAASKGAMVDATCLSKAGAGLGGAFTKAESKGDCINSGETGDVQTLLSQLGSNAATGVGNASTPSKCDAKKLGAMSKKASGKAGCFSKAVSKDVTPDACLTGVEGKFSAALAKLAAATDCSNASGTAQLEPIVDSFANGADCVIANQGCVKLKFTSGAGTTSCGSAGLATPPSAPFSGELDSDTAGTTKITDLGLGCLYIGGGTGRPPGSVSGGTTTYISVNPVTNALGPNAGTNPPRDCTLPPGPGKHCVNGNAGTGGGSCAADGDCAGPAGSCSLDTNCYFGAPLELAGALSSCILLAIDSKLSGSGDPMMGTSSINVSLASRVYLTGNSTHACPHCVSGACEYGQKSGGPCSPDGPGGSSVDCPPTLSSYQASLPINLNPLTTGSVVLTGAGGSFCTGQAHPGAFGVATAQRVSAHGTPAGNILDFTPHAATIASAFCIPSTGNGLVDGAADIPGPGNTSIPGTSQLIP